MGFTGREPPFFFLKPADAVVPVKPAPPGSIAYPPLTQNLHHEIELVVAIGTGGKNIKAADAHKHIFGYAVGLDMTRRDLQNDMKKQGRPWCIGKAFDQSAPIGPITPAALPATWPTPKSTAGQRRRPPAQQCGQADLEHRRNHRAPVCRLGRCSRAT
jgi:2-keto-4-pentenoate hydratase/2-oxohepta-3-ene-1,7-dioic acid hydratase in catechol pathway